MTNCDLSNISFFFLSDLWFLNLHQTDFTNFQALLFLLALLVKSANRPAEYDSDDEFIAPRQQIRQPLINRQAAPATGVPVAGTLDQRPNRNDAWSTRMREKVI